MPEVLCRIEGNLGCLTLNRPDALHALNQNMCRLMVDALLAWRQDDAVQAIWIDHAPGTRGFCAGGDIRVLDESCRDDGRLARDFFRLEYQLNHLIKTYPKPTIAIMDGVTMGGGVGVSVHCTHRVATKHTVFAMPETGIGLMPDVGGGWFLPRLPGEIGVWLGMTGNRLKAADCRRAGITTDHVETSALPRAMDELSSALAASSLPGSSVSTGYALRAVFEVTGGGCEDPSQFTSERCALINRLFAHDRAEDIVAALHAEPDPWAAAQLELMNTKSPKLEKVALRLFREGAWLETFAENMTLEYAVVTRVVMQPDFHEGVRAVILDKDNTPDWQHSSIAEVPDSEIDELFAPLPKTWPGDRLRFERVAQ